MLQDTINLISGLSSINQFKKLDKLLVIEIVKSRSRFAHTDDFYRIIDSNSFYQNVLNRVARVEPEKLKEVLVDLQELAKN